jgi:hypothetical protein
VFLQKHDNPEAAVSQNQTKLSGMKTINLRIEQLDALARVAEAADSLVAGASNGASCLRGRERSPGGSKTSKKTPAEVSYSWKLRARRILTGNNSAVICRATVTFARVFLN